MKALLIVSFKDYQDKEFEETKKALEKAGIEVAISSTEKGEAKGKFGSSIIVDYKIEEVKVNDFDAVVLIGGSGAVNYFDNQIVYQIVRSFYNEHKIVAAICCAPMILLKSGVLKSKKVTVWPDEGWIQEISKENKYFSENVVADSNIITANGPEAAKEFGVVIAKAMLN